MGKSNLGKHDFSLVVVRRRPQGHQLRLTGNVVPVKHPRPPEGPASRVCTPSQMATGVWFYSPHPVAAEPGLVMWEGRAGPCGTGGHAGGPAQPRSRRAAVGNGRQDGLPTPYSTALSLEIAEWYAGPRHVLGAAAATYNVASLVHHPGTSGCKARMPARMSAVLSRRQTWDRRSYFDGMEGARRVRAAAGRHYGYCDTRPWGGPARPLRATLAKTSDGAGVSAS